MRNCIARVVGLALAALSTTALAQSSVSVYGLLDLSIGRNQAPGGAASKDLDSGRMSTSYWGLRGTEDLGGGLKTQFAVESFMRADTGSAGRFDGDLLWARSAYVGLDGGFGSVSLGRHTTSLFVQTLIFNALGDSFGFSPSIRHYFTSGTLTGDSGWSDSVRYALPRMGGLSATVMAAAAEGNGGRNASASALYFSGAFGAGLVWQEVKKGATVQDTTSWQLAASYNLKSVKLFGQYGNVANDTTGNEYDILGIGATAPLGGSGVLRLQWGQIKPETGAKRTTLSGGYTHNLSKRTELYAVVMSDKISGLSSGTNYGLGVRHRF